MRVDTRDFKKLEKRTDPIITQGKEDHKDYVRNTKSPEAEDSEMFVRNTLENVVEEIKQWFIDEYDFPRSAFDNFPSLDQLVWNQDGWTIHNAILKAYEEYNKIRDKSILILRINRIIDTESIRLRNTVFDSANEREGRFKKVQIGGEDNCGNCGHFYGVFSVKNHLYVLPPFHPECECWAVYYN